MFYDSTMLLLIPALLLAFFAQARVKSAYAKWAKVRTRSGIPASDAAMRMLRGSGNDAVSLAMVQGTLTDHYDPRSETLSLSEGVYNSASIAAVGIAAHEAGHAMQKHCSSNISTNRCSRGGPSSRCGSSGCGYCNRNPLWNRHRLNKVR